ncbi:unnamed protein product [Blepharisma stoltei]|uniref:CCT domain-containing protein n=1 Tax=Blepharisma stoltei TaxID=1481888 RepID=A0AAU9KLP1_9CILI|nr:unnamed protein product [Blepharisma stoltei]
MDFNPNAYIEDFDFESLEGFQEFSQAMPVQPFRYELNAASVSVKCELDDIAFLEPAYMDDSTASTSPCESSSQQFIPKPIPSTLFNVDEHKEKLIGALTVQERREKIKKYQEKKKRRTWDKKISYVCRKKVADKRVRVKGRFVTQAQAEEIIKHQKGEVKSDKTILE